MVGLNDKVISITDLQSREYKGLALNDYTVAEIENTVSKYGCVSIPTTVIDIISDVRNPKGEYGVLATTKFLYTKLGISYTEVYTLCDRFVRKHNLIYVNVFNSLDNKGFTDYCKAIDNIIGEDKGIMIELLSKALNLSIQQSKMLIGIVLYLNSYNGFIMEYMVSEMIALHPTLSVMGSIELDGCTIPNTVLDKDWGIDLLVSAYNGAIQLPLQLKSYTHLGKSRTALEHTFKAHMDYKKKFKGLKNKETKGNVYYLHYSAANLSITIPKADFTHILPQSRELMCRRFDTDTLDLRKVPIWEVCYILEELSHSIKAQFEEITEETTQCNYILFTK